MDQEAAIGGRAILGGCKERSATQRAAKSLERILVPQVKCHIDVPHLLELLEEGLSEGESELDGAELLVAKPDRHDTANAQPGDAAFQPQHGLAAGVGVNHRLAKTGQVVAELFRQMDTEERRGGRGVELKLLDAIGSLHGSKAGHEKLVERGAIALLHRLLHRRHRRHQRAHRRGTMGFLLQHRLQRVVMAAQFPLVGTIDDAVDDP